MGISYLNPRILMDKIEFNINDRVEIIKGWFCTEKAYLTATKNGVKNWKPVGIIIKLPNENDEILSKEDTGDEELIDNYNVELDASPYRTSKIVTHLSFKDLKKI